MNYCCGCIWFDPVFFRCRKDNNAYYLDVPQSLCEHELYDPVLVAKLNHAVNNNEQAEDRIKYDSTTPKPISGVPIGYAIREEDTKDVYVFDGEDWVKLITHP